MPKPRRMLGDPGAPYCTAIMRLMDTRSRHDLAAWATAFASERCLPILAARVADTSPWTDALDACGRFLAGETPLRQLRPLLAAARSASAALEDPVAQAAARALSTACGACPTPTSALGFLFYACAAVAYSCHGVDATAGDCVAVCEALFEEARGSLEAFPSDGGEMARPDWGC